MLSHLAENYKSILKQYMPSPINNVPVYCISIVSSLTVHVTIWKFTWVLGEIWATEHSNFVHVNVSCAAMVHRGLAIDNELRPTITKPVDWNIITKLNKNPSLQFNYPPKSALRRDELNELQPSLNAEQRLLRKLTLLLKPFPWYQGILPAQTSFSFEQPTRSNCFALF